MTIKHIDSSVEQWEMDLSYIGDWPGCLIMIINLCITDGHVVHNRVQMGLEF